MAEVIEKALASADQPSERDILAQRTGCFGRAGGGPGERPSDRRVGPRPSVHGGEKPVRRGDARRGRAAAPRPVRAGLSTPDRRSRRPSAAPHRRSGVEQLRRADVADDVGAPAHSRAADGRAATSRGRPRACSNGHEIPQLIRRGIRTVGVHPWTSDDLPLIDEAQALVQGIGAQYGYVIVDEAQDLTPMQLRMVARRSRTSDMTLVGDMAQATGPTRYRDWHEIAAHLPTSRGVRRDELTIGYRVPRSIMELANLVLPMVAPDLTPTEPVREARVDPAFVRVEEGRLAEAVARAGREIWLPTTDQSASSSRAPFSSRSGVGWRQPGSSRARSRRISSRNM